MTKDYVKIIFNGGISTEPEVNELLEKIGIPAPAQQIAYSRITEIIKVQKGSSRWASVVAAWRRKLDRDHNILLKAVPNEGFEAMTNSQRIGEAGRKFKGGLDAIEKAILIVQKTDRAGLSDDEKRAADYVQNTGATLRATERTAARQLTYPELDRANNNGTS